MTDIKAVAAAIRGELRGDFRWLVGAIAGVALLGLGAVAWVSGKFDAVNTKFDAVNVRFDAASTRLEGFSSHIDGVSDRMTRLEVASERLRTDIMDRLPRSPPTPRNP